MMLVRFIPGNRGTPRHIKPAGLFLLAALCCVASALPAAAADVPEGGTNLSYSTSIGLFVVPREILFYSAQAGAWTSIKLDAGERVLRRASDGNVAAVVTSVRAIGFSAPLNVTDEIRVPDDETLEAFQAAGDVVTVLTRRRALGFSAVVGKWTIIDRFLLGR
ncbi:MAG TPA: hypothetical protein VLM91_27620 [Candidatus Methylomirabilis sp.]|nr:hypothetical protein [Candidatus Methylomirabilis sp.]